MEEALWRAIKRLEPLAPRFVSVTFGAGGSTRTLTHTTVCRILTETSLTPAAHLTCVGAGRAETDGIADAYWEAGVRHVVALRGDPPAGQAAYAPHPAGYTHAADLVTGLRRRHDFEISVAAYPEGHPESVSPAADLDNLKRKIDAGATRAITQFFFDNGCYLRFLDQARRARITVPIVPGILPVTNFSLTANFAARAGASVPAAMADIFAGLETDPETRRLVAITLAAEQVRGLVAEGVREFHFYTLNRADLTYALCHLLGLRPAAAAAGSDRPA
jgi:methylenetetrahydrofolate reductase (NADPH)